MQEKQQFAEGMKATIEAVVEEHMCAARVGSGSLMVLGSPVLVALMEKAACQVLESGLQEGQTSVGTLLHVEHNAPTPVGGKVVVTATLREVCDRLLIFSVEARDDAGPVATGEHRRFLVKADRFMEKAGQRK